VGWLHAAPASVEQRKPDIALEILQQLGRGRLSHVEHGRRLAQALHLMQRDQQQHLPALQAAENADAITGLGLVEIGEFHGGASRVISNWISLYLNTSLFRNTFFR